MKYLDLLREPSTATETMGRLSFDTEEMHTVEQEWRPTAPGGEPNNSCVPAGDYELLPYVRPSGVLVYVLVNPGLGVYFHAEDRPHGVGRFLIEIHAGNSVKDVIGCIAPGLGRAVAPNGVNNLVTSSRAAMQRIRDYIGTSQAILRIRG
jgi:Family of unknown function (DUF5675)